MKLWMRMATVVTVVWLIGWYFVFGQTMIEEIGNAQSSRNTHQEACDHKDKEPGNNPEEAALLKKYGMDNASICASWRPVDERLRTEYRAGLLMALGCICVRHLGLFRNGPVAYSRDVAMTAAQGFLGLLCLMYWMIAVDNPDLIAVALIAMGIGAIVAFRGKAGEEEWRDFG